MAENKIQLTKADRKKVCFRHQFLQGSWNYERMQNGGWCFAMIPAIKKLYTSKDDQIAALKRHLEFYNTHPYVSAPVIGVTLALEEERANGAPIDDVAIQGVKVGMMGPLAGVGDPVFWFTLRPILGRSGRFPGPVRQHRRSVAVLLRVEHHPLRLPVVHAGVWLQGRLLHRQGPLRWSVGKVTEGASILGMFIIGALVERWVSISFTPIVSTVKQSAGAFIDWASLPSGSEGIKEALTMYNSVGATALDQMKVTTLQANLDQLIPGLAAPCA